MFCGKSLILKLFSGDERKKKLKGSSVPKKNGTNYDTDNDGIDTEGEEKKMTSAERRKRRMSFQPPRKNSINAPANNKPADKNDLNKKNPVST